MAYDHEIEDRKLGPGEVRLPCGAIGQEEEGGIGVRCWTCLTVYGSVACQCTRENKDDKPRGTAAKSGS